VLHGDEEELMATFDYDVVIIGSGFGGSVAALRAALQEVTLVDVEAVRFLITCDANGVALLHRR
jgi:pyruvate/2-oxoglutarate dehydrogenase complex dihydrolipoamide dehydrogenase (E3) component